MVKAQKGLRLSRASRPSHPHTSTRIFDVRDGRKHARAFAEINDFEDQLIEHGIVLLKFWLQISPEEQLRRFKEREETAYKRWKLSDEDWRNRERWDDYALAAHEMIKQTSVQKSPWVLVENENKLFGRIKVLKAVCDALEKAVPEREYESEA